MIGPISLLLFVVTLIFYHNIKNKKTHKIFNVYVQPGKWYYLKFLIVSLVLSIRRLKSKLSKPIPTQYLEEMKPLSEHEKAFDATFFQAVSQKGAYFCGGIERRHKAKANGLFYLVIPNLGVLESLKLPNTLLDSDPSSVLLLKDYSAEGISFTPDEPMKKWVVSFNGKMRMQRDPRKVVDVKLEGEWSSDLPYFLAERDMSIRCLAEAMAREKWNKKFFKALKSAHQTHYEQMGYFNGIAKIDEKLYPLEMQAFKDHSYGYKRDWKLMHRYIFHMIYLTDDTRISIGVISQPLTVSHLVIGYVVSPDKTINPINHCDLILYQHAENGTPPKNYAFTFQTCIDVYEVKVKVLHDAYHFKGNNIEAKLFEKFIECEVNGMKGRGISEWQYNNIKT